MPSADPVKRVLVVCLRRLGDVLLSTPLAVSIKAVWPNTQIDWVVFKGTEGILQNNPAADRIFLLEPNAGVSEMIGIVRKIFQKYNLAISTQAGDRPSLIARAAGKQAITFASTASGGTLRDRMFSEVMPQTHAHRVDQILSLLTPLGMAKRPELSPPLPDFSFVENQLTSSYVVLHPGAAFRYKEWTKSGWRSLVDRFIENELMVVVTGGTGLQEKQYLDDIFTGTEVKRIDGLLSWSELTGVLLRAKYFVGVDTSVTHLAAACGVPGVAIFGPTDPALWGPCAKDGIQSIKVIQNNLQCVPCQQEGCERHINSYSLCLDTLDIDAVWSQVALSVLSDKQVRSKANSHVT